MIDAGTGARLTPWRISGAYFESCNCEAICPCRMVGGVKGGRSTYGICFGVLSWLVADGHAGDIDLTGLAAAFVIRYDDDEPGSPWSFVVHVDERGSPEQQTALAAILTGELGGEAVLRLPWVSKPSELLDVRASPIEIVDGPDGHELRRRPGRAVTRKHVPTRRTRSSPAGSRGTTSRARSSSPTSSSSTTPRSRGS